jgi:hypothetical protein
MKLDALLKEMTTDPEDFLRHYSVMIEGRAAQSGPATAWLEKRNTMGDREEVDGFTLSGGGTKKRRFIRFIVSDSVPFDCRHPNDKFPVWYVRMQQMSDSLITTHYPLPTISGSDIMLTSQLSGCSFGVGSPSAHTQLVSHIQPSTPSNPGLDPQVQSGLLFGQQGMFSRQQGHYAADEYATIIGIRADGVWRFYDQLRSANVGSKHAIRGVGQFA